MHSNDASLDLGSGPGPWALAAAASLDVSRMSDEALLAAVGEVERSLSWGAAVRARLVAEYASREVVDPRDPVEDRAMEWHRERLATVCRTSPHEADVRCATSLALRDRLPATAAAVESGSLPWAQAVVLARESRDLGDADSSVVERAVLADPRAFSVNQVARATRAAVAAVRPALADDEAATAHANRSLQFWSAREGLVGLYAALPVDAAAVVAGAIDPLAVRLGPDDDRTADQRRADALVALCSGDMPGPVQVQLLVSTGNPGTRSEHPGVRSGNESVVTNSVFARGARELPVGVLAGTLGGDAVAPTTVRRLTCDAGVSAHVVDDLGRVGAADARRRVPGAAMRHRLEARDQGCRFPGCPTGARRCHAHHLRHWADGGATVDANMILVCSRHHHAVHEGGWRLRGPAERLAWVDRSGRVYEQPPASASVTAWVEDPPMAWRAPSADPAANPDADAASVMDCGSGSAVAPGTKPEPQPDLDLMSHSGSRLRPPPSASHDTPPFEAGDPCD